MEMTDTKLAKDVKRYTDALNSAPNAWGQHIIDGMQSHAFLSAMNRKHGKDAVERALNAHYARVNGME
jgi:hypothetical protein